MLWQKLLREIDTGSCWWYNLTEGVHPHADTARSGLLKHRSGVPSIGESVGEEVQQ